jgi:hypothetical protein
MNNGYNGVFLVTAEIKQGLLGIYLQGPFQSSLVEFD